LDNVNLVAAVFEAGESAWENGWTNKFADAMQVTAGKLSKDLEAAY